MEFFLVPSECKENCMKSSKVNAENSVHKSKVISDDQSKNKEKRPQ